MSEKLLTFTFGAFCATLILGLLFKNHQSIQIQPRDIEFYFSDRVEGYKLGIVQINKKYISNGDKETINQTMYNELHDGCKGSDFVILHREADLGREIMLTRCRTEKELDK